LGLPDLAKELSSHASLHGLTALHDSFRSGDQGNTIAVMNGFDIPFADVYALAGFAHALEAEFFDLGIESDLNFVEFAILDDFEILDELPFLDHLEDRHLHGGVGNHSLCLSCFDGVAHPCEQVSYRVSVHTIGIKMKYAITCFVYLVLTSWTS